MQGVEFPLFEREIGVCIFTIPPLSTSKGYYLDDWKDMIWEGGIRVVDLNDQQNVIFKSKNNQEFARFVVPNLYTEAIQKTNDSARGYAMRLQKPGGGVFWIGVVFRDRNDAFDFNLAVTEYQEKKQNQINPKDFKVQDFTLKEKIIFTEHGAKTVSGSQQKKPQTDLNKFKFGDNPGDAFQPNQQQQTSTQQSKSNSNFSDFSNFGNFGNTQNNNFANFDDFSAFGNSNNNKSANNSNNFGNFGNNFNNNQQQQQQQNFGNFNNNNNNNNNNNQGQQNQQCDNLLDL